MNRLECVETTHQNKITHQMGGAAHGPNRGNFIAFVSSIGYRSQLRRSIATFREQAKFPSEGFAAPEGFSGVDFSDYMPFWNAGYPGLMVTDTAFLRNTNYHKETDTPDQLVRPSC